MALYADLHVHTTASDGVDTPARVVRRAVGAGLAAVAVADHDSVGGVRAAVKAAEGTSVRVVPAVELSARQRGADVHVLGYFVDPEDPVLGAYLTRLRAARAVRAAHMVDRLRGNGVALEMKDVRREARRGTLGRAHIARAMVAKGAAESLSEAFRTYLGISGCCYVAKASPAVGDCVGFLHALGAVPVIAHPGLVRARLDFGALKHLGLCGIEAVNPEHTSGQTSYWRRRARDLGLVVTGGSDWHGEAQTPHALRFGKCVVTVSVLGELEALRPRRASSIDEPALFGGEVAPA